MSKRKWRWVSMDDDAIYVNIWPGPGKPVFDNGFFSQGCNDGQDVPNIDMDEFVRIFGVKSTPKPNECIKVEFSGKVVK